MKPFKIKLLDKINIRVTAVHVILWVFVLSYPMFNIAQEGHIFRATIFVTISISICCFYFNYFFLVPRFLITKRYVLYFLIVLLIIPSVAVLQAKMSEDFPLPQHDIPEKVFTEIKNDWRYRMLPFILLLVLHFSISSLLRIFSEFEIVRKIQLETEAQKQAAELNFLKAQLNPHFFFNSLNTIFSLSQQKSPQTSNAVLNLSELMRYMLYETVKDTVSLQEEINYINNYIELQKLRLTPNNTVTFLHDNNHEKIRVPPLLFIAFIENAFKFGTSSGKKSEIVITIKVSPDRIRFSVVNDINTFKRSKFGAGGLGIENSVKRIALYFPERYTYNSYIENNKYHVEIDIISGPDNTLSTSIA